MFRGLKVLIVCALAVVFCALGHAQDSPSLGDLARQAQKDKSKAPSAKVITNDDLPSGPGSFAPGLGPGQSAQQGSAAKTGAAASPVAELEQMQSLLNQLDVVDRATLARNVLQGSDVNFPGRSKWEDKLFAAKQVFVAQGRDLMKRAEQIQVSAKNLQGVQNPNDPRAKDLASQLQLLVRDGVRMSASFQAVIEEGKDLAGQSSNH